MIFTRLLLVAMMMPLWAQAFQMSDLRAGDILVQSLPCSICKLIEDEEGLPYSHTGVVAISQEGSVSVLQALNNVEQVSLSYFLSKRTEATQTLVLRPSLASISGESLLQLFNSHFLGHHYDAKFLWNNADELGEKLYCSELVVKLLNYFLPEAMQPKAMHFTQHRQEWINFFHETPPDGQPGISPADLVRSPLFEHVGNI